MKKCFSSRHLLLLIIISQYLSVTGQQRVQDQSSGLNEPGKSFVPGQLLVGYKNTRLKSSQPDSLDISEEYDKIRNVIQETGVVVKSTKPLFESRVKKVHEDNLQQALKSGSEIDSEAATALNLSRFLTVKLEDGTDVLSAVRILEEEKAVFEDNGFELTVVEPNYIFFTNSEPPNDEYYTTQWALQTINAEAAWDISKGDKKVKVGIIDTGIDLEHEDLRENISEESYDFVDIFLETYENFGYSFTDGEDYADFDSVPSDYNGHGTHVAGIVGAIQNNEKGISGVCPDVTLFALRAGFSIINPAGEELGALESDDIANAIVYAADQGVDVLNMSFGKSSESEMQIVHESIKYAEAKGVTIIAAAGNTYSNYKIYPAAFDEVISVSAVDIDNKKADFSAYGDWIDVAAPGVNIYSTMICDKGALSNPAGYGELKGTSMAAPVVAGVAALLCSMDSTLSTKEIKRILRGSVNLPELDGLFYGNGIVDAHKALLNINAKSIQGSFSDPLAYEIYNEGFNVSGNFDGATANTYIGKGYYPNSWHLLREDISSNFSFDVSETFEEDIYTLKLEVFSDNDSLNFFRRFFIGDLKDMQAGWPVTLANVKNAYGGTESFTIGDINNDGFQDVVLIANIPENVVGFQYAQAVYVLDYKGEMVEGWPFVLPNNGMMTKKPVVCDINGDGNIEIVISSICAPDFYSQFANKQQIIVLGPNGSVYDGWPKYFEAGESALNFAVADLNADGQLEIITGSGTRACSNCTGEGKVNVFDLDGEYFEGWPVTLDAGYVPRGRFSVANLDDDKELEIAITLFHPEAPNDSLHSVCVFNHDGSVLWESNLPHGVWGWSQATADFSDDGRSDVMTQAGIYSHTGEFLQWTEKIYSYSDFAIANVDDDPEPEICYGSAAGYPAIRNVDGSFVPGWPLSENYNNSADRGILVADVAGDDTPEIIPLYSADFVDSNIIKPGLYVYSADGEIIEGFPRFLNVYEFVEAEVTDLDNDGDVEIIALDGNTNTIIVLDLEKRYSRATQEWPSRFNDNQHTNNYYIKKDTANQAPVIIGQHEVSMTGNYFIPTIYDLKIEDPDNEFPDDFQLFVQPDQAYEKDENIVYPQQATNESLIVWVTVSDGQDESEPFPLVVNLPTLVSVNEQIKLPRFKIYPNPFQTEIILDVSGLFENQFNLELFDISGRLIERKQLELEAQNQAVYFPAATIENGLYILRLSADNYTISKKIVKN